MAKEIVPTTSGVSSELFGDTEKYAQIMRKEAQRLSQKYPNRELERVFSSLSTHGLVLGPMAFCDALSADLGTKAPESILIGIGLSCLVIAKHDDVVDEMPKDRSVVSPLIFGGNITALEGIKTLLEAHQPEIIQIIIDRVNQNHYLQQKGVETLWSGKRFDRQTYIEAIYHTCVLTSIGGLCALAVAGRRDLDPKILEFSKGYGTAVQIIDDLREQKEDIVSGYTSLPILEGPPFSQSREEMFRHIELARNALLGDWERMQKFVDNLSRVAKWVDNKITQNL